MWGLELPRQPEGKVRIRNLCENSTVALTHPNFLSANKKVRPVCP